MSMMQCSRIHCKNMLCDRVSPEFGYICDPCFEELCQKGVGTDVEEFLQSHVGVRGEELERSRQYWGGVFRKR